MWNELLKAYTFMENHAESEIASVAGSIRESMQAHSETQNIQAVWEELNAYRSDLQGKRWKWLGTKKLAIRITMLTTFLVIIQHAEEKEV